MWFSILTTLRCATIILGVSNLLVVLIGGFLILKAYRVCDRHYVLPFVAVSAAACLRIAVMIQTGIAQETTAKIIVESPSESTNVVDAVVRLERRIWYKKWLWWNRFTMVVIVLQFVCATYLVLKTAESFSKDRTRTPSDCVLDLKLNSGWWKQKFLVLFMMMMCFIALVQCFAGSDVLRWRSFYDSHDNAWKYHYREVFDHGLRETLCCLGRVKYLSALEEDEVYSVARLLGDLVAYRASGTGHLELLAGLALLQRHRQPSETFEEFIEVPEMQIREAAALHKFAEAAYTGPLLDVGRNPLLFPCAWLYRQGVLSPWSRNRQPVLDGDNWWRGHAAAFLKYVNLPPEVLRHGRVSQIKCQAAYFVVVLHHLQSVVIAIRGTETPEDLITDGLCKECPLSGDDLAGLINCCHIHSDIKKQVTSSFPHYGHSGIVQAARELFMQIEGNPGEHGSKSYGLLSTLMGVGGECFGYNVRIVGHSLGGAIAALLGLRLYHRYPNLHVYSYGPLPCVDSVVANACSEFVTSIIYGNEFSSRLSIGSILRLRAAAITSLSEDPTADTAMIFKLARRFLYVSSYQRNRTDTEDQSNYYSGPLSGEDLHHQICISQSSNEKQEVEEYSVWSAASRRDCVVQTGNTDYSNPFDSSDEHEEFSTWPDTRTRDHVEIDNDEFSNPFATEVNSFQDPVSQFIDTVPSPENGSASDPPEMYLPGLVVHIVPEQKSSQTAFRKPWRMQNRGKCYKAYIANRESFKDIVVSPSMFLDHLPWRCHDALQKVLEAQTAEAQVMEPHII